MKKLLSLLLVFVLCLSLFACKTENEAPTESTQPSTTAPTEPTTQATEPTTTEPTTTEPTTTEQPVPEVTPLMYRVSAENGGVLYLLGSIHAADARVFDIPSYVMDAYHQSDFLAVECDIYALQTDFETQVEMTKMLLLSDGTKMQDHISPETYALTQAFLEKARLYSPMYDVYHPYLFISLVESLVVQNSGLDPEIGVDMQFLTQAHAEEKPVREVESVRFQYETLTGFSDELCDLILRDTVTNAELAASETLDLYEAWLAGDEEKLLGYLQEEAVSEDEAALYEEYYNVMHTQRNINMAEVAEQYLAEGTTGFYVVGMAHILGEGGIVDLLQQAGYTIENVTP